jgi:uncharacterized protein
VNDDDAVDAPRQAAKVHRGAIVSTAAAGPSSRALVATAKPSQYLLQLAKHFRHKLDVRFDERHAFIPFAFGHAELRAGASALTVTVFAQTPGELSRVEHVIAVHLERFGRRDALAVTWSPAT